LRAVASRAFTPCVGCVASPHGLDGDPLAPFLSFRSFGFSSPHHGDAFTSPPSAAFDACAS
jgi:hypothetical protein